MIEVRQTAEFAFWLKELRDREGTRRIAQRLARVQAGLLGDVRYFKGVGELRVDSGPGYRVYFVRRNDTLIVRLCGGDKSSQSRDIANAIVLSREV